MTILSCVFWFSLASIVGRLSLIFLAPLLSVFTGVVTGLGIVWILAAFFNVRDKSG